MNQLLNVSSKIFRKIYLRLWNRLHQGPNIHMSASSARIVGLPFKKNKAFIRPSASDFARINEHINGIYFSKNYLHESVKKNAPKFLIDVGANIGLGTLSLINEFTSLQKVVGIEADEENYLMLKKNYSLWQSKYPNIEFIPIYAIASASEKSTFNKDKLAKNNPDLTASGTFKFTPTNSKEDSISTLSITLASVIEKHFDTNLSKIICKIDIEGGEQFLLAENITWLKDVCFLTIEVHDRFDKSLIHSSQNLFKVISDFNLAVVPETDVVHCYSRSLLGYTK